MKTETFYISELDIQAFKAACKKLYPSIEFVSYENSEAKINYKYAHTLFYLGSMMRIENQLQKL